jgi:hypothetical protein
MDFFTVEVVASADLVRFHVMFDRPGYATCRDRWHHRPTARSFHEADESRRHSEEAGTWNLDAIS